ncbi:SusD/RagB family nutrient-binding outer membrane lipoprotein [Adhaeribacter radiodurans]|uniref:SusD/RagB family nutrient-binding outer membrane lipoprotein n=1 Tax=Adhaeribacter radiodurans TaxID=2745197 RepID=A0A7L7LDG2_9BACT|nr:SusD/RagB family nutrient-binding outer membrane lipoprotein [Adhaeribacter radiodurans]QMU30886.1 SusD/RagB family nutrient-binding outer membrane lipoprotein [Adhaeribacter radiodurans]
MKINSKLSSFIYSLSLCASLCLVTACDDGFEEMNVNPNAYEKVVPEFMFSKALYDGTRNRLGGADGAMQYTTSFNEVAGFGSKYIFLQGSAPYGVFTSAYTNEIQEITDVILSIKDDPNNSNKLAASRIWRAYSFHRVTDLYGDIPYTQAGLGYREGILKPKYDKQEDIYKDMLKELEEATSQFDASKPTFGNADVIYGGNIDKWKKFGYSLMLRLGMRLTKVDPTLAEAWVRKAIAGGVIVNDADIAQVLFVAGGQAINQNPLANSYLSSDYSAANGSTNREGGKYANTFINYLQNNNDPRLRVLSVVWVNGKPDTTAAIQKGMPQNFQTKPADFVTYSEPNPATLLRLDTPVLLMTSAEMNFLLAEAALRSWYTGETPEQLYNNGVRSAMKQWGAWGGAGLISDAQITTYLASHPYNAAGTLEQQMEQIHTQFWASLFPDSQEVFANWRRTGYPALVPNNVPGNATNATIFRRMLYPTIEESLNPENLQEAVNRLGGNTFLTRIWWDK